MNGREGQAPLLEASGLRIAVDGSIAVERFDLVTTGERLALVGDTGPLMSLLTNVPLGAASLARASVLDEVSPEGVAAVASGTLRLFGADVGEGLHMRHIGAAPLDPPLPLDLSAIDYVTWSGRLAGLGGMAKARAAEALAKVGLGKAQKRVLRSFSLPERRVLALAQAVVSSPAAIVVDAPLADLEGAAAAFVLAGLFSACEERAVIVSLRQTAPRTAEGQVAATATDLAFLSRGELVLHGAGATLAAGGRLYGLTVRSNAEALRQELSQRGIELRGGPLRFSATLPDGTDTRDILAAAAAARSAVVELLSLM